MGSGEAARGANTSSVSTFGEVAVKPNELQRATVCWELLKAEAAADQVPGGAAPGAAGRGCQAPPNPSAPPRRALRNLTTKDSLQFLSFNGPLCKPLIPSSLKSDLNALVTIYRRTFSGSRAGRVLLLLFISPSQQALSCPIHHGEAPVGRYICPGSGEVLRLCQGCPG